MNWFGWLTKPRFLITGLDSLALVLEILFIVIVCGACFFILESMRIKKIKQRHGNGCTCWTCIGVR